MANETKVCKHCKTEIPKGAKVCPNCRKKQGGIIKWIIFAFLLLVVIAAATGGDSNESASTDGTKQEVQTGNAQQENDSTDSGVETKENIEENTVEYTACTVNQMMEDLSTNAMKASSTYKDQYLEITGRLANIDSNGEYISICSDNEFDFIGVQCYLKSDEQKEAVMNMNIGDTVTLKGKCWEVGEVLGYYFDIDSIVQ